MRSNRFLCGECTDAIFHGKRNTSDSATCCGVISAAAGNSFAGMGYNRNAAGVIVTLANIGKLLFPLTRYDLLFFPALRVSSRIYNIAS